jgi:katanin p60 ATPase-containing subunit A1
MFKQLLTPDIAVGGLNWQEFAEKTNGYSGSDIRLVCKEAAMRPLRKLMADLQREFGEGYLDRVVGDDVKLDLITREDVLMALEQTSASDTYDSGKYEQWQKQYGVV